MLRVSISILASCCLALPAYAGATLGAANAPNTPAVNHLPMHVLTSVLPATGPSTLVIPGDRASFSLFMLGTGGATESINDPGAGNSPHVVVSRGPTFSDIGSHRTSSSGGHIEATWDEAVSSGVFAVRVRLRTSSGEPFVKAAGTVGGQPIQAWTWRIGIEDPIEFDPWASSVQVFSAIARFSSDGGATYTAGSINFTASLASPWPGVDNGVLRSAAGDISNAMFIEYKLTVIPAPAPLALLTAGVAFGYRRRR